MLTLWKKINEFNNTQSCLLCQLLMRGNYINKLHRNQDKLKTTFLSKQEESSTVQCLQMLVPCTTTSAGALSVGVCSRSRWWSFKRSSTLHCAVLPVLSLCGCVLQKLPFFRSRKKAQYRTVLTDASPLYHHCCWCSVCGRVLQILLLMSSIIDSTPCTAAGAPTVSMCSSSCWWSKDHWLHTVQCCQCPDRERVLHSRNWSGLWMAWSFARWRNCWSSQKEPGMKC